jgi:hypothetical protein
MKFSTFYSEFNLFAVSLIQDCFGIPPNENKNFWIFLNFSTNRLKKNNLVRIVSCGFDGEEMLDLELIIIIYQNLSICVLYLL